MGVFIACGQVGAGQPSEGERRAVGSATEGLADRSQPDVRDGSLKICHQLRIVLQDLFHIPVLFCDLDGHGLRSVLLIECSDTIKQVGFPLLKYISVKIPNDQIHLRLLAGCIAADNMVEALFFFCKLGLFMWRQHLHKSGCDVRRVDHDSFGGTGVHAASPDPEQGAGRVEGLVLVPAQMVAVQRIGDGGSEAGKVQRVGQPADFLVRRKSKADQPMRNLRVRTIIRSHCHDGRDGSFIVAAKECCAIRQDQVLPDVVGKNRIIRGAHDNPFFRI